MAGHGTSVRNADGDVSRALSAADAASACPRCGRRSQRERSEAGRRSWRRKSSRQRASIGGGVGQVHGLRILEHPVDTVFVVQVRPGREPRHADVGDDGPLGHMRADARAPGEARQVAVHRDDAARSGRSPPGCRSRPWRRRSGCGRRPRRAPGCRWARRSRRPCGRGCRLRIGCMRAELKRELTRVNSTGARRNALCRLRPSGV